MIQDAYPRQARNLERITFYPGSLICPTNPNLLFSEYAQVIFQPKNDSVSIWQSLSFLSIPPAFSSFLLDAKTVGEKKGNYANNRCFTDNFRNAYLALPFFLRAGKRKYVSS